MRSKPPLNLYDLLACPRRKAAVSQHEQLEDGRVMRLLRSLRK
jgi:hypothetical protein